MARTRRVVIQGYIKPELKGWVEKMIEKGVFRSEAHAVERGLQMLRNKTSGTVLDT